MLVVLVYAGDGWVGYYDVGEVAEGVDAMGEPDGEEGACRVCEGQC